MQGILSRYGMQTDRKGFLCCPFHEEKSASMKIYKDSYHCFGCGANGDIFTFVQQMEEISFKEAYVALGGIYNSPVKLPFSEQVKLYQQRKKKQLKQKFMLKTQEQRNLNNTLISVYRKWMDKSEPLSDVWCDCYNNLQYQLYLHDVRNKKG